MNIKIKSYINTSGIDETSAIAEAKIMVGTLDNLFKDVVTKLYYIIPALAKVIVVVSDGDKELLGVSDNVLANTNIGDYQLDRLPASILDYKELIIKKGNNIELEAILNVAQTLADNSTTGVTLNKLTVVKIINYNDVNFEALVIPSMYNAVFTSLGSVLNTGDPVEGNLIIDASVDNGDGIVMDLEVINKIVSSSPVAYHYYARSVGVSNSKIIVGAHMDGIDGLTTGIVHVYDLDGSNEIIIAPSDGSAGDGFGEAVDISETHIIVGAYSNDDNGVKAGVAYIYDIDGSNEIKITPSDTIAGDEFGRFVAISNNKIVIGSHANDDRGSSSGCAYLYDLDGTNEIKLIPSDSATASHSGYSVAISDTKVVVGAYGDDDAGANTGAAYLYDLDGTNEIKIVSSDNAGADYFGRNVGISNNKVIIGTHADDDYGSASGAAYLYDLDGTNEIKITPSDPGAGKEFGHAVAITDKYVVICSDGDGSIPACVYDLDGLNEIKLAPIGGGVTGSMFGRAVACSDAKIVIGAERDNTAATFGGAAHTYG